MSVGDDRTGSVQGETAPEIRPAERCKPGFHRCEALMLAFFAIEATGAVCDLTRAAVARCEAGLAV